MCKKLGKALTALFLAAAMLLGCMPAAFAAKEAALQIGVISDLHYFSQAQAGDYCEAFLKETEDFGKLFEQSQGILESGLAALAAHAKKNGMKVVLIPGDMTRDGEPEGHRAVAARLERFEKETGLQVAVVGGNHDINNDRGLDYSTGKRKPTGLTTPQMFREIYANLGFDLPNAAYYTPPKGETQGMLSYAADLGPDYRLIALDEFKYDTKYNGLPKPGYETSGLITEGLMQWAVEQCRQAVKDGKTVLGMGHHNLTPHVGAEERIFTEFMLDDWLRARETLADAGMHFYFSGHIHQGEIGDCVSDDGETLFDICTTALVNYPCTFREVRFTSRGKNDVTAQVKTFEADCVLPVTANGVTYPAPFSKASFRLGFTDKGLRQYIPELLTRMVDSTFRDIQAAGGLSAFLKASGLDLNAMLAGPLASVPVISASNVTGLLQDIFKQVDRHYISNPERTLKLLLNVAEPLLDMQVSPLPSTRLIGGYGLGNKNRPGTLADLADAVFIYTYGREGGAGNDKFLNDAIARFENGENTDKLVGLLLDVLLEDLLEGELLPTLRLNLSSAIPTPLLRLTLGALLDGILQLVLLGDNTFAGVANLAFQVIDLFDIAPYTSLDATVELLLDEYWTPSQSEGIGYQVGNILRLLVGDQNSVPDNNPTLRYTGPRKVTPAQADYRLPSMVTQMLPGPRDSYDRAFSWYTKDSLQNTDIRVFDAKGNNITKELDIKKTTEAAPRGYPGVDLGIAGFITPVVYLNRHRAEIAGLEPGQAYTYQVGDAARGWWSPKAALKLPEKGETETTFLSFSDMQSQTPKQYARAWGSLSEKALGMYPNALFAVSPGDIVDNAANLQQWTWGLDAGQKLLRALPMMPATGNHEDKGAAMRQYFPFGQAPAQNADSGTYYSFDCQNVHVTVLNTNDLDGSDRLALIQLQWMKADIKKSRADWKIVLLHKAMYSDGSHFDDSDVTALREQLTPLFGKLGVDLVVAGHDHTYLRTEAKGVQYLIAGTSGVKYYKAKSPEETAAQFPAALKLADAMGPIFAAYEATANTLTCTAYRMDVKTGAAAQIDSFVIEK